MSKGEIILESNPKEHDYEDYICAYFQSGGLYVEKSIILRETEEILELDIIITDFTSKTQNRKLIEIKSGNWGFSDIFKVKGWLVYLNMKDGVFVVKKSRSEKSLTYFKKKAEELNIKLIDNVDLNKTNEVLSEYLHQEAEESEIETLRFSYLLERKLLKQLKTLKRKYPDNQSYINLDDYFFKVNSGSFFSNNPVRRINQIFEIYLKYKNITAKLCFELENGFYEEDVVELSSECFKNIFYKVKNSPLQIALYVEHMARLTILKSCTEHLLKNHKDLFWEDNFIESLEYLSIPQTIKKGLDIIVKEPYFHRYPVFWQFFTFVMGGFILKDFKEKEYEYISRNTGIPIENIPDAFESYNKIFPKPSGWMFSIPKSNIEFHRFFPVAFSGIGANHRRFIYLTEENQKYEDLEKKLTGEMTIFDLIKWNGLAYNILK